MRQTIVLFVALSLLTNTALVALAEEPPPLIPVGHTHSAGHGGPGCCCEPAKICVPMPDKKKETRVTYDCKVEDVCLPRCPHPLWALFHKGGCDQCLDCDKPRTRRVLIKRIREEECDVLKCKPVAAPCAAEATEQLPPGYRYVPAPSK